LIYDKELTTLKTAVLQAISNRVQEGEVENFIRNEGVELVGNSDRCTIFRLRAWLIVLKIGKEEESGFKNDKKDRIVVNLEQ